MPPGNPEPYEIIEKTKRTTKIAINTSKDGTYWPKPTIKPLPPPSKFGAK